MDENQKFEIIKKLVDTNGNKKQLQSRLPVELRLGNVSSIDEANEFLNSYIKKFNKRFALPIDNIKSVFEKQPEKVKSA